MKALVLINAAAGGVAAVGAEKLSAILFGAAAEAGWSAEIVMGGADELALAASAASSDLVFCAGGDGTLAAVATRLMQDGPPFVPLPCGTMNLFCRDLGYSADPAEAVRQALGGVRARVDVGIAETAERGQAVFLNNIVFGTFAEIAEAREKLREAETPAATGAAIVEAASALINAAPSPHTVSIDGVSMAIKTNTLLVSNNSYTESVDLAPRRARLDAGALGVYLMAASGPASFASRIVEFLNGTLDKSQNIELLSGKTCLVARDDGATIFAIDGEKQESTGPVAIRIAAGALSVIKPATIPNSKASGETSAAVLAPA